MGMEIEYGRTLAGLSEWLPDAFGRFHDFMVRVFSFDLCIETREKEMRDLTLIC